MVGIVVLPERIAQLSGADAAAAADVPLGTIEPPSGRLTVADRPSRPEEDTLLIQVCCLGRHEGIARVAHEVFCWARSSGRKGRCSGLPRAAGEEALLAQVCC